MIGSEEFDQLDVQEEVFPKTVIIVEGVEYCLDHQGDPQLRDRIANVLMLKARCDELKVEQQNLPCPKRLSLRSRGLQQIQMLMLRSNKLTLELAKQIRHAIFSFVERFPEEDRLIQIAEDLMSTAERIERQEQTRKEIEWYRQMSAQTRLSIAQKKKTRWQLLLQDLKSRGSIRVYCRIRPAKGDDVSYKIDKQDLNTITVSSVKQRNNASDTLSLKLKFDYIFTEKASQADVFEEFSSAFQTSILDSRFCLFSYGQTGSGKTHTMIGYQDKGIVYRALEKFFEIMDKMCEEEWNCSLLFGAEEESYLGRKDLLTNQFFKGKDSTCICLGSLEQARKVVKECVKNRFTKETEQNTFSSRSHLFLTFKLERSRNTERKVGLVCLVDLAGSQTARGKIEFAETIFINQSLQELSTRLGKLKSKSKGVVSASIGKRLHALNDFLRKETVVMTIINISPETGQAQQSKSSLGFAINAKGATMN